MGAQRVAKAKQCPNEHLAAAEEGLKLLNPHFVMLRVAPHAVFANCSWTGPPGVPTHLGSTLPPLPQEIILK